MAGRFLALFVLFAVAAAGCSQHGGQQGAVAPPPPPAQPDKAAAPAQPRGGADVSGVKLKMLDGSEKTIGDYAGKVLLLDFWATYCRPCIEKLPKIVELAEKYREKGLEVVVVALDPDPAVALGWAKKHALKLPMAQMTDEVKEAFFPGQEVVAIPQWRLVGRDGKVVGEWGPDGKIEELESAIQQALGAERTRQTALRWEGWRAWN